MSVFYSLPSAKNTHADIRMQKYACSVKGNIKQTRRVKILHVYAYFLYAYPYFFTNMRTYGRFGKSRLRLQLGLNEEKLVFAKTKPHCMLGNKTAGKKQITFRSLICRGGQCTIHQRKAPLPQPLQLLKLRYILTFYFETLRKLCCGLMFF